MRTGERTFCRLDTKWLCQNSTIFSVSGDAVVNISVIHQARSSAPCSMSSRWASFLWSSLIVRSRRGD